MESERYEFRTSRHETIGPMEGEMTVKLPGASEWKTYIAGEYYEICAD